MRAIESSRGMTQWAWIALAALAACGPAEREASSGAEQDEEPLPVPAADALRPAVVTERVGEDSDDPALWIDPADPSRSLIVGTDKSETNGGLYVFRLDGSIDHERTVLGLQRPNNVDVQDGFVFAGDTISIAVATERLTSKLRVYRLPEMTPIDGGGLPVFDGDPERAPMGVALYRRASDGAVFAFVGGKSGPAEGYVHQMRLLEAANGTVRAEFVRALGTFSGRKEIEAMAVDDALGWFYYADEGVGIRKYPADPDVPDASTQVALFGTNDFKDDHEGIAFWTRDDGTGWILVSNQQDLSLNVYRREGAPDDPHAHSLVATIPVQALETDGVEATSVALGPQFPQGAVILMSTDATFHIYRWQDVEARILAALDEVAISR